MKTIIHLLVQFKTKGAYEVKRKVFIETTPPEGMEKIEGHIFLQDQHGFAISGLIKDRLNKPLMLTMTENTIEIECWCEEWHERQKMRIMNLQIQHHMEEMISLHQEKAKNIEDMIIKGYTFT